MADIAISIYEDILGYSEYYSNPINWIGIKKIYFIGNDGFIAIKNTTIWAIVYRKTSILRILMGELAKNSYGNMTYTITNPLNSPITSEWFRSMGFPPKYYNDGTISLELDSKQLRDKFILDS